MAFHGFELQLYTVPQWRDADAGARMRDFGLFYKKYVIQHPAISPCAFLLTIVLVLCILRPAKTSEKSSLPTFTYLLFVPGYL